MAQEIIKDGVQTAGDIDINEITLICVNGTQVDLRQFLVELSITEDIFSTSIYGNIMLSDSNGIIEKAPIIGEEYIRINVVTPGMKERISKTFRVYNISDRNVVMDDKSQVFIMHFCSPEVFVDASTKIYKTFSGRVDQVVETVYLNYLKTARNITVDPKTQTFVESKETTDLIILNESENNIKFTCPGWGALKTLSWLASKSITKDTKSADTLFYEASGSFCWGSVGSIIKGFADSKKVAADFYYAPNNLNLPAGGAVSVSGVQYKSPDINRAYKIVDNFTVLDSFNTIKSMQSGHFANQIVAVDLTHKSYKNSNYDYVSEFDKSTHLDNNRPFTSGSIRSYGNNTQVSYQQKGLFTGFADNVNERVTEIKQNRMSLLAGLNNIRLEITVPGRTDFQAGNVIYFGMPKLGPKDRTDKIEEFDRYMSGLYLVTCVRHKMTYMKHMMVMEIVKDSLAAPIQ